MYDIQKATGDLVNICHRGSSKEPMNLVLMSDVHFDNPKCNRKLFFKHLKYAQSINAKVLIFGDLLCLMQGRYDPRRAKSSIRPEHNRNNYLDLVIEDTAEQLKPYAENIALISEGNHESSVSLRMETNVLDRLIERLKDTNKQIVRGKYQGFVSLKLGKKTKKEFSIKHSRLLAYHHGKFGGVVTKGVLGVSRYGLIYPQADYIVSGHTHDQWLLNQPRYHITQKGNLSVRNQWHIKTGTYKEEFTSGEGWAVEKIVMPKSLGAWHLQINMHGYGGDQLEEKIIPLN